MDCKGRRMEGREGGLKEVLKEGWEGCKGGWKKRKKKKKK